MSMSTRVSFVIAALAVLVLSAPEAQAKAAGCRPCQLAQELCSVNCFGLGDRSEMRSCLVGCDNAAAVCSCDEPVTLRSEDVVAASSWAPPVEFAGACHSTTPCGPSYGSCASWSSYSDCGDPFCGIGIGCGECNEWGQCEAGGPAMKQFRERYRVCFNAQSQQCTEYQRTSIILQCGC